MERSHGGNLQEGNVETAQRQPITESTVGKGHFGKKTRRTRREIGEIHERSIVLGKER
jgi:hypothetical protein